MEKFIPREKLGKKARKRLDSARRSLWTVPPVTRKVESRKRYDRKRKPHPCDAAWTWGFSLSEGV